MEAASAQKLRRLRIYTTTQCGDCVAAKAVLNRVGVNFEEINIDLVPAAVDALLAINGGYRAVPTILLPDGRVLVEPSSQELLSALRDYPTLFEEG